MTPGQILFAMLLAMVIKMVLRKMRAQFFRRVRLVSFLSLPPIKMTKKHLLVITVRVLTSLLLESQYSLHPMAAMLPMR